MAQSQNTRVDFTIKATSYHGLTTYGDVMVGDRAFEFYNERNVDDFIQIPWNEVDHVAASVLAKGRTIARFAVFTKGGASFSFSTRDNKRTLRAMREHLDPDQLVRSLSFFEVAGRGLKSLISR
ncbi:DUF956 family protein [Collinsella intestinalis]|uniref:DUF956 family protein n=1 Tax=Collinsella intestinalis TaxID=147207 RepID=UPI0025A3906B|nr:DUF956 family protein [Collinsella intestinalis]MDM8163761.1 DUF956 family protein [Collinsella intestinalis]